MIEQLDVTALGVVARARIRPSRGLTVITGETGTGKTMVLTSLGLLLGRRADPGLVRHGADRAVVEGTVLLDPASPAGERAVEAGADFDEGALFITRTVPAQGRSRAHLGGRSVPSGVLAEVLGESVTVHGQADQLRLKSLDAQRDALDLAAGPDHAAAQGAYAQAWTQLRRARAEARSFRDDTVARRAEIAALRDVVTRWDEAEPQEGEDAALREEAGRLGNVEELRRAAARAHGALQADADDPQDTPGAAAGVEHARAALEAVGAVDPALGRLADRVAEIGYQVTDVATELASYLAALEGDPLRLDQVHARIAQLTELTRGYEDLPAMAAQVAAARARLGELTGPGADAEAIQARLDAAAAAVRETGAAVTAGRRRAADLLGEQIDQELAGLSMPGAHLEVALIDRERPAAHGLEDVEFRLRPHPGAPSRPLGQGASGGELSRVMLALELVLARAAHPAGPGDTASDAGPDAARPTMVFDEIDAGIGGRTATQIGRRLASLAEHVQVVVVTHLAQVAAFADTQYVVAKDTSGAETVTTVTAVEGARREAELARMLSGHDTRTARQHAAELLAAARVGD